MVCRCKRSQIPAFMWCCVAVGVTLHFCVSDSAQLQSEPPWSHFDCTLVTFILERCGSGELFG